MNKEGVCKNCGSKWVVNKTYTLCHDCNYKRLHDGLSVFDIQIVKMKQKIYNEKLKPVAPFTITKNFEETKQKENKAPKAKINQISKNNKNVQKDPKFFNEIWSARPHVSEISGADLGDNYSSYFCSHILTKGAYPKFRHNPDNIKLVTKQEHDLWEFGDRDKLRLLSEWDWVFEKEAELIQLYYKK